MNTVPSSLSVAPGDDRKDMRSAAFSGLLSAGGTLVFLFVSGIFNARALGPTDRGYFALVTLTPTVVITLAAFGMSVSLIHFVASQQISAIDALRELRSPIVRQATLVLAATGTATAALNWDHPPSVQVAGAFSLLAVFTTLARDYGLAVIQGCEQTARSNLYRALPGAFWAVAIAAIYFLLPGRLVATVLAFILADGLASLIIVLAATRAARAERQSAVPAKVGRGEILQYGRRAYFGVLSPLENLHLDQFFVSVTEVPSALGAYAIATSFTNIPRVVATNLGMVASPIVSAAETRGASPRTAAVLFLWLTLGVTVAITAVLAVAVTFFIPLLFGEAFRPAVPLCQVLLISGPMMAIRRVLVDVLRGAGRPVGSRAEVLGLVVFAIAAPLLGSAHGPIGVAWAYVAAMSANLVLLVALELTHRRRAR